MEELLLQDNNNEDNAAVNLHFRRMSFNNFVTSRCRRKGEADMKTRVLVVDDSALMRRVISDIVPVLLEVKGYSP